MSQPTESTQTRTLLTFTTLYALHQNWPGSLILNIGLDDSGTALALASNIVGAACLTLEPNPILLRTALRLGACDFIVNTLDEALRTMKNEIRKHRPLSVGLGGNPEPLLAEILERGVLPQLFTTPTQTTIPTQTEAAATFQSQGATILTLEPAPPPPNPNWNLQTFPFQTPSELQTFDIQALNLLPPEDNLRCRWLQSAPRIFHRERPLHRTLWLTAQETRSLSADPAS
jgi:Urocanase Rossmann-like domain